MGVPAIRGASSIAVVLSPRLHPEENNDLFSSCNTRCFDQQPTESASCAGFGTLQARGDGLSAEPFSPCSLAVMGQ